ncbi:DUF4124 domain-containing protein [Rhodanobacter sp. DHB23]|uniref:DUF4124 domain-containing protein n=1 Tax=Rhodanobacter sp. DHB23 TaxID=2775923 RepID=UPI00178577D9|nr:DUF4124 domain-containing protein [Rhodanobacter sp. DHB23]MBD8874089.1 DUF4124 domain-containing protein [Rhodanobacter sp. DHB23]
MRAFALLLLTLCILATAAQAQGTIHRCVDAHGNPLFTDQPCPSQQAAPAPAASLAPPGAPAPLQRCAATAAELRQRVVDAFAAHDPNRLAGLMLWGGYGNGSTTGDLRALAQLVRQPLLEIHFDNESADGLPPPASSTVPPARALRLRTDDGGTAGFAITRQAGCLWLRQVD